MNMTEAKLVRIKPTEKPKRYKCGYNVWVNGLKNIHFQENG